jgi:hypothetical protein
MSFDLIFINLLSNFCIVLYIPSAPPFRLSLSLSPRESEGDPLTPTEKSLKRPKSLGDDSGDETMLCKRVVTKDRRYITQITCYEKGADGRAVGRPVSRTPMRMPLFGAQGSGGVLSSLFSKIGRQGEGRRLNSRPNGNFKQSGIFHRIYQEILNGFLNKLIQKWYLLSEIPPISRRTFYLKFPKLGP